MAEVMTVSGKVSVPHAGHKRGDRVRIVIDGVLKTHSVTDTVHEGTEYKYVVNAQAGILLPPDEAARFDDPIAEALAAQGEEDARQGRLDGEDGENLPLGDEE